ncbi:MAG: hypothetical protein O3C65_15850 [Proteobacteria bacterium]|nr:hypothetical protein [Pseudomonadota bacterium]MDA1060145.1 hypothetical protein [Pseudomonadota bacterium]
MARLLGAALAGIVLVAACSDAGTATTGATEKGNEPADAAVRIPANAIPIGEDVYMVPLGPDGHGCTMYQAFSPTKMVAQVIQYQARDGRFVMDKRNAECARLAQ